MHLIDLVIKVSEMHRSNNEATRRGCADDQFLYKCPTQLSGLVPLAALFVPSGQVVFDHVMRPK